MKDVCVVDDPEVVIDASANRHLLCGATCSPEGFKDCLGLSFSDRDNEDVSLSVHDSSYQMCDAQRYRDKRRAEPVRFIAVLDKRRLRQSTSSSARPFQSISQSP